MSMPNIRISRVEYNALPLHTEATLPKDVPIGFKCRNKGGLVCEWVKRDDMFANQVSLLSAPAQGFRYFSPLIIESSPLEAAQARVVLAEKELADAREALEKVRST